MAVDLQNDLLGLRRDLLALGALVERQVDTFIRGDDTIR